MLGMELKGQCLFGKGLKFWEVLPPYCVDLVRFGGRPSANPQRVVLSLAPF